MAYSNEFNTPVFIPEHDFGNGDGATSFRLPKGMRARLRDIHVTATETFNSVTTEAFIKIGTAADDDAFATVALGDLADTDTFAATIHDTDAIIDVELPLDTQIEVALIGPTGGTPAGKGRVTIHLTAY